MNWEQQVPKIDQVFNEKHAKTGPLILALKEQYDQDLKRINMKYKNTIAGSNRFPDHLKKISNFNNDSTPFHWLIENMALGHLYSALHESKKRELTGQEKEQYLMTHKFAMQMPSRYFHYMSLADIQYLEEQLEKYFNEQSEKFTKMQLTIRSLREDALSSFVMRFKSLKRPSRPSQSDRYYENNLRNYYIAIGLLEGISFSKPLASEAFKVQQLEKLKTFTKKITIKKSEVSDLLTLSKESLDIKFVDEGKENLTKKAESYENKPIGARIGEKIRNQVRDDGAWGKTKGQHIQKVEKWSQDFVVQANAKKLKKDVIFSNARHWYQAMSSLNH